MSAVVALQPRGLTQRAAAEYVGVSVRWFRDHVHVEAKPVGRLAPGKKPLLRYRIEELDAWMDTCAQVKADPNQHQRRVG